MSCFPSLPRAGHTGIGNNVNAGGEQLVVPQAFIDNPEVDYYALFNEVRGIEQPLGTITKDVSIAIVGLGTAGCFGGGHLARAGAKVTAYERADEPGGRLKSIMRGDKNVYELGGMRFPPCETLMYMSAHEHGFGFISGFPDPGVYPTLIVSTAQNAKILWDQPSSPPKEIKMIIEAFLALEAEGITKDGKQVLCSLNRMQELLRSPDINIRKQAVPEWQKWIDVFRHSTFEKLVRRIWGENHEWDVPGGRVLTDADIKLFGDLGFGSGGFKHFFDVSGLLAMKLLVNGLETNQSMFAKRQPDGTLSPAPVQDLVRAQWRSATDAGMSSHFGVQVTDVTVIQPNAGRKFRVESTDAQSKKNFADYDAVILTISPRTRLMQKIARRRGSDRLFSDDVCDAILGLDVIASTKLFNLIPRYIDKVPKDYPRNVLTDIVPGQLYTLDYGDPETIVALEDYRWAVGSLEVQDHTAEQLHETIITTLERATADTAYADLPDRFQTDTPENLVKVDWQNEEGFHGAFALPRPDQVEHVCSLVYDFLKLKKNPGALPISNASDMMAHESGWVDGTLRNMTNTVTALIDHFGTLKNPKLAPVNVMTEHLYQYQSDAGSEWESIKGWDVEDGEKQTRKACGKCTVM